MSGAARVRDPYGPIESVTWAAFCLVALVAVLMLLAIPLGWHPSLGAWGDSMPCVVVPQQGLAIAGNGSDPAAVGNLRPGVTLGVPEVFRLCRVGMGGGDRLLVTLPIVLDLAWSVGFLLAVQNLVRRARRHGPFTRPVARGITQLGGYVLAGWLLVDVASAIMRAAVTSHLVRDYPLVTGLVAHLHWSWAIVIAGCGLLSMGRIMRLTIPMREDLEATV